MDAGDQIGCHHMEGDRTSVLGAWLEPASTPRSPSDAVPASLPQDAGQRQPASCRREQSLHRGRAIVRNVPQREGAFPSKKQTRTGCL